MEGLGVIDPGIQVRGLAGFLGGVGWSSPAKGRTVSMAPRGSGGEGDGDCRICLSAGDFWVRVAGGDECGEFVGQVGGFSHESEHDLAVMVSDFLENGSGGAESRYSSDSDSGFSDLGYLAQRVLLYKHTVDEYQIDLLSAVHSLLLSMHETDLHQMNDAPCNSSCIRQSIVKSLRLSGYDAAVCSSKWQGYGKVPGGDHEYIDVSIDGNSEDSDRLIVDIDFRSHFEIARAVESYDRVLTSLPVVYVGSLCSLEEFLQVMVEASKCSLKQNSMPLPPWRSLAYLRAKWHSKFERIHYEEDEEESLIGGVNPCDHKQCRGHLRRLKASLQAEMDMDRLLKPVNNEKKRRVKFDRQRQSLLSC